MFAEIYVIVSRVGLLYRSPRLSTSAQARVILGRLLLQPDLLVEHLELGLVYVVLHPRLRGLVERRAGDRVPVELVGAELLELLGDGLALRGIHLPGVAGVVLVDLRVGVARAVRSEERRVGKECRCSGVWALLE